MKKIALLAVLLGMCLVFTQPVQAQWTENFDSYAVGNIDGNGPWVDWGGNQLPLVTTDQASSAPNSLGFSLDNQNYGTDVYATTLDPNGVIVLGQCVLSYMLYVDSNYTGQVPMYISQFAMDGTGAGFANGVWLRGEEDGTLTLLERGAIATPATLIYDAWKEIQLQIDLDANTVAVSYDGSVFYTGDWDIEDAGANLGGINFWASASGDKSGNWYVDDFSLTGDYIVPEPATMGLLLLGGLAAIRRRK